MKRNILFKSLIDILFFFLCFGVLGVIFILPFGSININQATLKLEDWSVLHWVVFTVTLTAYITFLIAIYQLRKVAYLMLKSKVLSESTALRLKKSGKLLIASGLGYFLITLLVWMYNLYDGTISFMYDSDSLAPLFIIIMGLFFMIQSDVLITAKRATEENDLTI